MSATYLAVIRKFFEEDEWPFKINDNETIVSSNIKMDNGTFWVAVQIMKNSVVAYATCTEEVPPGLRVKVAEFICRANYGLPTATIEIDFDDGSLRCRSGLLVDAEELTSSLVGSLVYSAAQLMNRYYPGVMALIYSSRPLRDILAEVEG